jgi:hypothetical protein
MKFRKRPVVIDAYHFLPPVYEADCPQFLLDAFDEETAQIEYIIDEGVYEMKINTLEGVMTAVEGDWIIQGVNGEIYPCKPDIFEKTYEKVEDTE